MTAPTQLAKTYRFGIYEAFPESGELLRHGQRVKLQEQPFRLLISLLEQPGEVVSREALSQRLWPGDTFVEFDQSLGAAVMKLRQALNDDADNPRFIETVPRRGFRFIAPVSRGEALGQAAGGTLPRSVSVDKESSDDNADRGKGLSARWMAMLAALIVIAVLVVVVSQRMVPLPPPSVVSTSQLTHDGNFKSGLSTDGSRLYTVESRGSTHGLAEISVDGGEAAAIATPFVFLQLHDISPDGKRLMATSLTPTESESSLWALRLPNAEPERLGNVVGHGGAWSKDGKRIVFAHDSQLLLANADGTDVRRIAGASGAVFGPRFSPDGGRIRFHVNASDNTSSTWEVRVDGTELHRAFTGLPTPSSQCCGVWSPDGRYYFFVVSTGKFGNIWAQRERNAFFERSASPVQLTTGPLSFGVLTPSPDGKKLYAEAFQSRAELVRYDSGTKQFLPYLPGISAGELNFSLDGKWVAYISYPEGTLWRSRVDGSERLQLTRAPLFAALPRWSPDGAQIAFTGAELGKPLKIFVLPANGGVPREAFEDSRRQNDVSWSADGKSLAFGRVPAMGVAFSRAETGGSTEKLEISLVDMDSHHVTVLPGSENLFSPRWSPDGRYIVALTGDSKKLIRFDFKTQKWSEWVGTDAGTIGSPAWSRDSEYVYFEAEGEHSTFRRIKLGEKISELIVDPSPVQRFVEPYVGPWCGLTPDGAPLFVRDLSTDEIYALELQLP